MPRRRSALFEMLPIGWIVLSAVFLFHLTVRWGSSVVKHSVAAISPDRRMQALLMRFSFGTFVEGGRGPSRTPVAISAAIGLGFSPRCHPAGASADCKRRPQQRSGRLGTPITTLAKISGCRRDAAQPDSQSAVRYWVIVPAWLVATMAGAARRGRHVPAILVCGGSFMRISFDGELS